jgi:hypothetical protein
VLKNRHYVVEPLAGERIVVAVRSVEPFATKAEVDSSCGALLRALDTFGRSTSCVLIDSRLAPGRTDPHFDGWFARYRSGMLTGFLRAAILVQSAVGRLHADRLLRLDEQPGATMRSFTEQEQALTWLREVLAPR